MAIINIPTQYAPQKQNVWQQLLPQMANSLFQNMLAQQMWKERFRQQLPMQMLGAGYREVSPMQQPMESWAQPGAVAKIGGKYWERAPDPIRPIQHPKLEESRLFKKF